MTTATLSNTESLIRVDQLTELLGTDSMTLLSYCAAHGISVCIAAGAITDIPTFVKGFRSFQAQSDAEKLSALFSLPSQGVAATTPENNGANGAKTEPTIPEPVTTDTPTEATETPAAAQQNWKLAKQGKTMMETIKNLVAKNDPDYSRGFVNGLRLREPGIVSFVNGVITKYYKETPGAEKRMWTAIDKFLSDLDAQPSAPATEKKTRTRKAKAAA